VFYDLSIDPYELNNLIADPTRKDEIERHRNLLHDWSVKVGENRLPLDQLKTARPAGRTRVKPKQETQTEGEPANPAIPRKAKPDEPAGR
jgi:hypothetical protein